MTSLVSQPLQADMQHNTYNKISSTWRHPQGGSSASSYATKGEGHPPGNDTPSAPKVQLKILFAALTSATVIIFLVLACRFVRAHSWAITRKLSSHNPSGSGSRRQAICEDSGDETPEDADPKPPQAPLEPPKPKKAKEAGGGLGAQSVVEEEPTSGSDDEQPSTSAGRKRKRKAGAPPSGTANPQGPESPARSEGELEAASALVDLQYSLTAASEPSWVTGEPSPASVPSDVAVQGLVTSVGASQTLAPTSVQLLLQPVKDPLPSASALLPVDPSAPSSAAALSAGGTGAPGASTSYATFPGGEQPSTSFAAPASAGPGNGVHPYYRTPSVNPMHLTVRRFKPEKTTAYGIPFSHLVIRLRNLRFLLSRETLTSSQLDELAQLITELSSYIFYHERASTGGDNPAHALRTLGRRFLLLDMVIAALEVLREPVCGPWWDRIAGVIPDDTPTDETAYTHPRRSPAARSNLSLVERLNKALRILKTGKRLAPEETVAVKRMLFFSPHSPFNNPRWEPWREDDRNFGGTL